MKLTPVTVVPIPWSSGVSCAFWKMVAHARFTALGSSMSAGCCSMGPLKWVPLVTFGSSVSTNSPMVVTASLEAISPPA